MSELNDYKLKVWSNYEDAEHDGYCSDGYNFKTESGERVLIHEIPEDLPDSAIAKNGAVDVRYTKRYNYRELHGNGYCGLESTQTAYRAMIVKNPVTRDYYNGQGKELDWGHEDDDDYDSEYDYTTDDEVCRCTCHCRRRCKCVCPCASKYKNRKIGEEYLDQKNQSNDSSDDEDEEGSEDE
jgi:hypothetical protein